jgi:hypothetical protein
MRILLSCLQSSKRHSLPAYEFWRSYFVEGCREVGIEYLEVPGVDWAEGLVYPPGSELDSWRARTWESVMDFVRRGRRPVDFFLCYLYPKQVDVTAIGQLKQMGIPAVNFFCDNFREFRRVPIEYQPFALHWVPELEAVRMYQNANLPYLHAPMPCWVPPSFRNPPKVESEPATFIGSADILRRDLLNRSLQKGADFVVRGPGWRSKSDYPVRDAVNSRSISKIVLNQLEVMQRHGMEGLITKLRDRLHPVRPPPLSPLRIRDCVWGAEYMRVTREAMVAIGVNRVPTARASNRRPLAYSRLRDIEAPMLGACYLAEWTEGLAALYEQGTEVEFYRTADELADKLAELTQDPERRGAMRHRAQRRALADHSVGRSIARVGARLGLSV